MKGIYHRNQNRLPAGGGDRTQGDDIDDRVSPLSLPTSAIYAEFCISLSVPDLSDTEFRRGLKRRNLLSNLTNPSRRAWTVTSGQTFNVADDSVFSIGAASLHPSTEFALNHIHSSPSLSPVFHAVCCPRSPAMHSSYLEALGRLFIPLPNWLQNRASRVVCSGSKQRGYLGCKRLTWALQTPPPWKHFP